VGKQAARFSDFSRFLVTKLCLVMHASQALLGEAQQSVKLSFVSKHYQALLSSELIKPHFLSPLDETQWNQGIQLTSKKFGLHNFG
jgi:hypothetical protein